MIFADKVVQLRKKSGWSQEELAEKLNVTRQSVSKWEGAQSIPDLEKILQLAQIFGVSTDYLLKDELAEAEYTKSDDSSSVRRVSMEEANAFLQVKQATAGRIAFATFLCILSPICLFQLAAASETGMLPIRENLAGGAGMIVMLLLVAVAVAMFISCGGMTSPYAYLEAEVFETEYGVSGMVRERQRQYRSTYTRYNVLGACLCILSAIPLFGGAFLSENGLFLVGMLSVMLLLIGLGVIFFIVGGVNWARGSGAVWSRTRPASVQSDSSSSAAGAVASTSAQRGNTRISPRVSRVRPRAMRLPRRSRWVRASSS